MHKLDAIITKGCQLILWLTMSIIFSILCINTLLRYVFGSGMQWANEVPELLFPWLVMSGVVLAAEKGSHIATVFLVESVKACSRSPSNNVCNGRKTCKSHNRNGSLKNSKHKVCVRLL